MDLPTLLNKYPFRLAREQDNEMLLKFSEMVSMDLGHFQLKYSRRPNFFSFLRHQSNKYFVFIYELENECLGMGTLILRQGFINQKPTACGYLGDLRLSPAIPRRVRLQWRVFYQDLLDHASEIEELEGCRYFYTAILESNSQARQSLVKPDSAVLYRKLQSYSTIHIPVFSPFAYFFKGRKGGWKSPTGEGSSFARASPDDETQLRRFLHKQNKNKIFGFYFPEDPLTRENDEWAHRFHHWEGLKLSSFIIARDSSQNIIGCVAPWSNHITRGLIINKPRLGLKSLLFMTKYLFPFFGVKPIKTGEPLSILYLTHFEISYELPYATKVALLQGFFQEIVALHSVKPYHLISFHNPISEIREIPRTLKLRYLQKNIPGSLYQVVSKKHSQDWLETNHQKPLSPPGFEIATA